LRHVRYGSELIINGNFATNSDWTLQSGWSILSGQLNLNTSVSGAGVKTRANQSVATAVSSVYKVLVTVSGATNLSGNEVFISFGDTNLELNDSQSVTTNGVYETVIVADSTDTLLQARTGSPVSGDESLSIDSVSVREVIFDRATDPLIIFNHPRHVPRIEYDTAGNLLGLLVEDEGTNYLTQSNNFGGSPYTRVADVSVATSTLVAPDGTLTASKITGTSGYIIDTSIGSEVGVKTIWARTTSGTGTVALLGFNSFSKYQKTITPEWQRFDALADENETGGGSFYAVDFRFGTLDELHIWQAQGEGGLKPTSNIFTTGNAATRAADIATIPSGTFPYNTEAITIHITGDVSYVDNGATVETEFYAMTIDANNNLNCVLRTSNDRTGQVRVFQEASNVRELIETDNDFFSPALNVPYNIVSVHEPRSVQFSINGNQIPADTTSTELPNLLEADIDLFRVGCGHIKTFSIIPRAISPAQQVALTS